MVTLYGRDPFSDEQTRMLQMVTPHLAQMFLALDARAEPIASTSPRSGLRIVASR